MVQKKIKRVEQAQISINAHTAAQSPPELSGSRKRLVFIKGEDCGMSFPDDSAIGKVE